jgi:DNA-binding FadR family transcriptional regulator
VLPTRRWNQFDTDVLAWRVEAGVDAALLDQLYEIRECFEPRACFLAASHGRDEERASIERHYKVLTAQHGDAESHIAADLEFHLAIFAATQNRFFISLGSAIATALRLSFALSQHRMPFPAAELVLHGDVARAIAARDAAAAEHAMRMLLQESRRTLGIALDGVKQKETPA